MMNVQIQKFNCVMGGGSCVISYFGSQLGAKGNFFYRPGNIALSIQSIDLIFSSVMQSTLLYRTRRILLNWGIYGMLWGQCSQFMQTTITSQQLDTIDASMIAVESVFTDQDESIPRSQTIKKVHFKSQPMCSVQ